MKVVQVQGRADTSPALVGRSDGVAVLLGQFPLMPGVVDSFTDVEGTVLSAHVPEVGSPHILKFLIESKIESNELVAQQNVFPSWYTQRAQPSGSGGHKMTMKILELGGGSTAAGFNAHYQSNGHHYSFEYRDAKWKISIWTPTETILVSLTESQPAFPYTLEAHVRYGNNNLRLLVDGVQKLAATDDTLSGGQSGVRVQKFGANIRVDDYRMVEWHGKFNTINGRQDVMRVMNGRKDAIAVLQGRVG